MRDNSGRFFDGVGDLGRQGQALGAGTDADQQKLLGLIQLLQLKQQQEQQQQQQLQAQALQGLLKQLLVPGETADKFGNVMPKAETGEGTSQGQDSSASARKRGSSASGTTVMMEREEAPALDDSLQMMNNMLGQQIDMNQLRTLLLGAGMQAPTGRPQHVQTQYIGVRYWPDRNAYEAFLSDITGDGKLIDHHLGWYNTAEEAARAYDLAAYQKYGPSALSGLNFTMAQPAQTLPLMNAWASVWNRGDMGAGAPAGPGFRAQRGSAIGKGSSKFRGVSWHKDNMRWRATIFKGNKPVHLGYFEDQEEAARAYDREALKLRGPTTLLNFPLSDYQDELNEMGINWEDVNTTNRGRSSARSRRPAREADPEWDERLEQKIPGLPVDQVARARRSTSPDPQQPRTETPPVNMFDLENASIPLPPAGRRPPLPPAAAAHDDAELLLMIANSAPMQQDKMDKLTTKLMPDQTLGDKPSLGVLEDVNKNLRRKRPEDENAASFDGSVDEAALPVFQWGVKRARSQSIGDAKGSVGNAADGTVVTSSLTEPGTVDHAEGKDTTADIQQQQEFAAAVAAVSAAMPALGIMPEFVAESSHGHDAAVHQLPPMSEPVAVAAMHNQDAPVEQDAADLNVEGAGV